MSHYKYLLNIAPNESSFQFCIMTTSPRFFSKMDVPLVAIPLFDTDPLEFCEVIENMILMYDSGDDPYRGLAQEVKVGKTYLKRHDCSLKINWNLCDSVWIDNIYCLKKLTSMIRKELKRREGN